MASTEYSDNVVDVKVLQGLVGSDWVNESALFASGIVARDTRPIPTGTLSLLVRNRMFEGDQDAQAIGINSALSRKERKQYAINHPIVRRADSAFLDDIQGEIQSGTEDMLVIADEVRRAAAVAFDTAVLRALEGGLGGVSANQSGSGAVISLDSINTARFLRGDKAMSFENGFILMPSRIFSKAISLGLVAATSNTWGSDAQNKIVLTGQQERMLGFTPLVTDKITLPTDTTKDYVYLLEKASLVVRGADTPIIESVRSETGFGTIVRYRISFTAGLRYVSWQGAQSDVYTNDDLVASTNWTLAAESAKHVPAVRLYTAQA